MSLFNKMRSFVVDERGATAIEYALIASTISIVIVVAAMNVGSSLSGAFTSVKERFPS